MELIEAVILGIVQGVTEWLPVSSEGVNSLIMVKFFGRGLVDAVSIAVWLHAGTLLAATVYFRSEIGKILENVPPYLKNVRADSYYSKITSFLIISTFVTGIVGLPVLLLGLTKIDFSGELATAFIGVLLIITGVIQKYVKKPVSGKEVKLVDSIIVGCAQAFSILPGLSRSGLTVSALLLRKYRAEDALKLSFLMSIPAVLFVEIGLGLLKKIVFDAYTLLAVALSFAFGLLTIGWLMRISKELNFGNFCIFLGLLSIASMFL